MVILLLSAAFNRGRRLIRERRLLVILLLSAAFNRGRRLLVILLLSTAFIRERLLLVICFYLRRLIEGDTYSRPAFNREITVFFSFVPPQIYNWSLLTTKTNIPTSIDPSELTVRLMSRF